LKTNISENYNKTLSSYRAVNTFRLGYKHELVNVVHGYYSCLLREPYKIHKYNLWALF
jgi:hypothetical protein